MTGIAALEQFSAEIDRLNLAAPRPNPFLSSAFLKTYSLKCEYHVPDKEERLYLIWDGPRLIGCAPMRRSIDGRRFRAARITGWSSIRLCFLAPLDTELPGVLAAPEDEDRVARALIRYLCDIEPGWDLLELAGQRPGGSLYRAAHAAASWRFRVRDIEVQPCNDIALVWNSLDEYFRSLAKKMRSNISRQARRLFAAGEVELILADGAQATTSWFDAYCELDSRSWKSGTAASIRRDPRRVRFYQDIVGGKGGMDPSFIGIVLDGTLIAGLILGSNARASPGYHGAWCLEMAYDQSQAELGPGQLLLLLAVSCAIEGGHRHLSFMQNFSCYKHRWGALPIDVANVTLIRRATLRNLVIRLREIGRKANHGAGRRDDEPVPDDNDLNAGSALGRAPARPAQQHARAMTSLALASTRQSVRRLDLAAARACLPFPIG